MKKQMKVAVALITGALLGCTLAGCDSETKINYNRIGTQDEYTCTIAKPVSDVVAVDDFYDITVDGNFDEELYETQKWYTGYNTSDWGGHEEVQITTYFAKTGILIGIHMEGEEKVYFDAYAATGNISAIGMYFNFGDALMLSDGVYEIECTAAGLFKISKYVNGTLTVIPLDEETRPLTAVVQNGSIVDEECTGYDMEWYLPYSFFGRETRPSSVMINPHIISYNIYQSNSRSWHNLGYEQNSNANWGGVKGYEFNRYGFVSNKIEIKDSEGGTVEEEYGYDWCVSGDTVNFNIIPQAGKAVTSIKVNGVEKKNDVRNNRLAVICDGDITVEAEFGEPVAIPCTSTVSIVDKDNQKVDLGDDTISLTMTDRDNRAQTYTVELTKIAVGTYSLSGNFLPGHYNLSLSVNGYVCTSAGYDESNSPTTQLWIDETGGLLWSVTFTAQ